ncbi:MAG: hypothetical protein ACC662_08005, partial [Planctomycetota bacterium]
GTLLVRLLDEATGKPIAGMAYAAPVDREVAAHRFPGFVYRAGSAASGEAEEGILLRALVPGEEHRVRARAEGYVPAERDDVLPSGASEPPVELVLRLRRR